MYALFGSSVITLIAMEAMSRWYEGIQARPRGRLSTDA